MVEVNASNESSPLSMEVTIARPRARDVIFLSSTRMGNLPTRQRRRPLITQTLRDVGVASMEDTRDWSVFRGGPIGDHNI